jgi:hypothetical protein
VTSRVAVPWRWRQGVEDERARERHGGGGDGEAHVGTRRGRRHPPCREIQLAAAASAPTGEEMEHRVRHRTVVVGRAGADGRGGAVQTRRADECDWEWRMTGGA